jgi:serine/threonine protein kinase
MIILEFAEGGDLFDYMSKQGRFCPEVSRTYIKQLLLAI